MLAILAAAVGPARADEEDRDAPASPAAGAPANPERLSPRNDAVFLSLTQIRDDALAVRDVKVSVGAPVLRGDGYGLGLFTRYSATWIDSDQLLSKSLVLHKFDLMLGGGGELAPGWSLRGAAGVAYASDLHAGLGSQPFQVTTAGIVRHTLGPSDAWMVGVVYASASGLYPVLPILGYVHERAGSRFRFDASLPHHVRASYQLTSQMYGTLALEAHGDQWAVQGMHGALDVHRGGGAVFGELGIIARGSVHLELRAGASFDSYTLPDLMAETTEKLALRASTFTQLLVVVAP